MANFSYLQVQPQVGIFRDGTNVDTNQYIDGTWVRFYNNRAKKMGGYQVVVNGNDEIIRNLATYNNLNAVSIYVGQPSTLGIVSVSLELNASALSNITPAGFTPNINNLWYITSVPYIDSTTKLSTAYVVAVAAPSAQDISNTTPGIIYYGALYDNVPLQPLIPEGGTTPLDTASCVANFGSYLFVGGLNGSFTYNDGVTLNNFPSSHYDNIGTSKFIYAAPVRTNGQVAGLGWTLDGVVSFTLQDTGLFQPAYVSTISTILSQGCVVSYDPYFYWIGSNTFFVYNGSVMEVDNNTNKIWFFKNLNQAYKNKVVGFVNKKYNEICWLAPMFGSTENNWMIIYNINTQAWYDTPINRSCAASSTSLFPYPLMADSKQETYNNTPCYPIWAHEYGVNQVDPVRTSAIYSSFTTNKLWLVDQNPEAVTLMIDKIIPDVQQTNDMFFTINTQAYPNSAVQTSSIFDFTPTTEYLSVRLKGSLISLTFTSNVLDGDYLFGKTMIRLEVTDDQRPGASS